MRLDDGKFLNNFLTSMADVFFRPRLFFHKSTTIRSLYSVLNNPPP
jgi:hypothetical protein